MRNPLRANVLVATAVVAILLVQVNAALAACINPPLAEAALQQFRKDPSALVLPDADTRQIEGQVRDLAGTDAALAGDLVKLARQTTQRFQVAIAAGLAQAATVCTVQDPKAAQAIQEAVASFDDGEFQAAFAAVAGDISTAATLAAAAYSESSTGSVAAINANRAAATPGTFGGGAVSTLIQLVSPGSTAIVNGTAATNGFAATAAEPISPIR